MVCKILILLLFLVSYSFKSQGDIVYKKLLIEDGAKFEGKCDLIDNEDQA